MHAGHITLAAYGLRSQSCLLSRVSFIGLTCCLATADITRAFSFVCVTFERLLCVCVCGGGGGGSVCVVAFFSFFFSFF